MRVLIIETYPLFREAIAYQVLEIVGQPAIFEAASSAEALALLALVDPFDLVICSLDAQHADCLWLDAVKAKAAHTKILVFLESDQLVKATQHKDFIDGFLAKCSDTREVKNALRLVLAGEGYLSPSLLIAHQQQDEARAFVANPPSARAKLLTPRQLQVLRLIAFGFSNKAIANELNCSDGTIKLHVSAILKELKVSNRLTAIKYAAKLGLIPNN